MAPRPLWERPDTEDERAYQQMLKKRLQAEEEQLYDNYMQGDYLGLEDGRPGISLGPDVFGGVNVYMPWHWRFLIWIGALMLLVLAAMGTRACVGEERAQEILHGEQVEQQ